MIRYFHLDTFGGWVAQAFREARCFFSSPRIGHTFPESNWDLDPEAADTPVDYISPYTCTKCGYHQWLGF